jgi:hypothetical protein
MNTTVTKRANPKVDAALAELNELGASARERYGHELALLGKTWNLHVHMELMRVIKNKPPKKSHEESDDDSYSAY